MQIEYRVYQIYQVHSAISQAPAFHLQAVLDATHSQVGPFSSQAAAEEAIDQLLLKVAGPFTIIPAYLP